MGRSQAFCGAGGRRAVGRRGLTEAADEGKGLELPAAAPAVLQVPLQLHVPIQCQVDVLRRKAGKVLRKGARHQLWDW